MIYTGIDYHKRYSVACTLDAQGQKLHEARIDGNVPAAFAKELHRRRWNGEAGADRVNGGRNGSSKKKKR